MFFTREKENHRLVIGGATMGTSFSVQVVVDPNFSPGEIRSLREKLSADIEQIIDGVVQRMSFRSPDSEISRFNRFRGAGWFPVTRDTARVVSCALKISGLSGGSFDITMEPLVTLWGFGPGSETGRIPTDREIAEASERVGYRNLRVRRFPPMLKKRNPRVTCDFSAIAKGFAVDRIAEYLDAARYRRYLVEIGGEIRSRGKNHVHQAWSVGIETPDSDGKALQRVVRLNGNSIATSGDTHIYFEKDGVRYGHSIHPATGRPLAPDLASVTVIHPRCMVADALATAIIVLGSEKGHEFALASKLAALLIVRSPRGLAEKMTPRFIRYLAEPAHA
jgi:thiamine biosynthesis lipoprotein